MKECKASIKKHDGQKRRKNKDTSKNIPSTCINNEQNEREKVNSVVKKIIHAVRNGYFVKQVVIISTLCCVLV